MRDEVLTRAADAVRTNERRMYELMLLTLERSLRKFELMTGVMYLINVYNTGHIIYGPEDQKEKNISIFSRKNKCV